MYLFIKKQAKCNNALFLLDLDECATGVANCHRHAECTNTEGSYYCECSPGYMGNGHHCSGKTIQQ